MYASFAPLAAPEILTTLRHETYFLFLGAAFATVGLVAAAFLLLARRFTPLLLWFSLFSILYGLRLWFGLTTIELILPAWPFLIALRHSIQFLLPIPAIFYFEAAGFFSQPDPKATANSPFRWRAYAFVLLYLGLFLGSIVFGPLSIFDWLEDVVLLGLGATLTFVSLRRKSLDADDVVLRRGLNVFVACILVGSVSSLLGHYWNVEPLGFAVFLGTLGFVAARRSLSRDQQLNDLHKELEVARRIEMAILPRPFHDNANFRVGTRYVPMTSVAGDFYDFPLAGADEAGLLIADVSGHGVPAALIASMVKLAAASQRACAADPAAFLSGMNAALCGNTQDQFVTAAYVHLDAVAGRLRYAAAGHPPMLLLRNGTVSEVLENGLFLAAFPSATFTTVELPLEPGDRLLLYTDGIVEAADASEAEFSPARLKQILAATQDQTAQQAADAIIQAVQQWAKSQDDDLTVLVCDFAPKST